MDSVWHLNAPQWTDFESSPQTPDESYFERIHENLEPQPAKDETSAETVAAVQTEADKPESKMNLLEVPGKNDSHMNEIEIATMTPVKLMTPKLRNKDPKVKEITYDNVLSEAMASLQLSARKKSRRSQSVRNTGSNLTATPSNTDKTVVAKSLNLIKGPRSTPSNPIPMWIRKTRPSEININRNEKNVPTMKNQQLHGAAEQDNSISQNTEKKEDNEIDKDEFTTEQEKPVNIDNVPNIEELATEEEPELANDSNEVKETVDDPESNDIGPPKQVSLAGPSKRNSNISQRSSFTNKGQQPRFSTCQLRRRSLTKYRRRSNKYISLAEAISKFQNRTPVRFRTVSSKNVKPGPLQKVRQSSVTATVPISPALRCKSRTRPTTVLSQEERERLEMEEIRKNSVRENMTRTSSLKTLARNSSSKSKCNAKNPATLPEPSHSIETKNSHAHLEKKIHRESRNKVTVPLAISTGEGIAVEDAEISNFGVPDMTSVKQNNTKIMPFSFETRNKELQKKKEKKIKDLITEEEKKTKVLFHARPVPSFKKPMLAVAKEVNATKLKTRPCPFSFEERDKNLMKKKENYIKNVLEEDKKARVFQAKPIPEFKPVLVRGTSKENISSGHKPPNPPPQKTRISMLPVSKTGSRNCLLVKTNVSNQENQNPSATSSIPRLERAKSVGNKIEPQQKTTTKVLAEFHLNTDKRAKERREFDERIKQKEQEIELLRKEAEAEKLKRDEIEKAEIRRMAETKARPMPTYKLPAIIHSDKPLTEPLSPGWATKPKC